MKINLVQNDQIVQEELPRECARAMSGQIVENRLVPLTQGVLPQEGTRPTEVRTSFASHLLSIAGGQFACVAVAALTELCVARLLGPAPQGLISLCLMSIVLGAVIGSVGSEATVVVWISKSKGSPAHWFPAIILWIASGSLLACTCWVVLYWEWRPVFLKGIAPRLAWLVLIAIPGTVLFSIVMAIFAGEERFRIRSVNALVNRVSALVVFLTSMLLLGRRPEAALLGYLGGLAVATGLGIRSLPRYFREAWNVGKARQSLFPTMIFGLRGQAGTLATFVSYRLDVFVVNYFLDASQVGLYSVGVLISEVLWQLPAVVSTALCPRTARTVGSGADSFTCLVHRQVFLVTALVAMLIAIISPIAIPLVLGSRFAPSVAVVWWIMPGTIVLALGKVSGADLVGRGLNIHTPISSYLGMIITLLLDFALIPRLGIQGAAIASSLAYLAGGGYLLFVLRRELKVSWRTFLIPTREELFAYQRYWKQVRKRFRPGELTIGSGTIQKQTPSQKKAAGVDAL